MSKMTTVQDSRGSIRKNDTPIANTSSATNVPPHTITPGLSNMPQSYKALRQWIFQQLCAPLQTTTNHTKPFW